MKYLLIILIKIYWQLIPRNKRRCCIFRVSCSQYVYQQSKQKGLIDGLKALHYRISNCRGGFQLFDHPIDGSKMILLPTGEVLEEHQIATHFLHKN
ncbi:membrane protein insertion efficiency factor YidD [Sphingobacterium sp. SRCM116780]|uniref:membrane protein insertion efficiency factor YidD n=1 Tax=Sphingobacterium sp. SRCM116780 TaxID=2907623 RepID=UPI00397F1BB7